jgi:hypothetical protein
MWRPAPVRPFRCCLTVIRSPGLDRLASVANAKVRPAILLRGDRDCPGARADDRALLGRVGVRAVSDIVHLPASLVS